MPRSFFRDSVLVKGPAGTIPLAGAAVSFYLPAAPGSPATPISFPLYRGRDDPDPMVLPYVTGDLGELEVWADAPHRIRIIAAKSGLVSADETIDLEAEPDLGATDEDITDALAAHEADLDPHDQYLTQPEGNLLYLPLAHQPGTDPHPQYLQASVFTQPDPLGQYQLETEKAQPSGYAPLDPGGLIPTVHLPPLAITNTFVVASEAEMLALVAQTGDLAIRSDTTKSYILAADPASLLTNWKELSAAAPVLSVDGRVGVVDLSDRYVDVAGDTLTGLLTTTFGPLKTSATAGNRLTWAGDGLFVPPALDQAAADLRYLQLSGGALTGPLSIQSKPVAVSPDAGNILQWLPNGLFAGLSTANVTVLKREEFSPPSSSTSVTLAASPNTVLEVSRNGVAQSQALGHYTLLGAVVTFADAFVAGEQVLVLSEVGTSQPVDAYTKAQSDARYLLLTGGAVTGATTFAAAPTVGGSPLLTLAAGDARYPLKTDVDPYPVYYNQARGDARYLQTATAATTYLPLVGGTLTGVLRVNANVGVGVAPAAWAAGWSAVQAQQGSLAGVSGQTLVAQNVILSDTWRTIAAAPASFLQLIAGGLNVWTAPSVGAGAALTMTQRLGVGLTGTLTLTPDAGVTGQVITGSTTLLKLNRTDAANYLSYFGFDRQGTTRWNLGLGPGDEFIVYNGDNTKSPIILNSNGTVTLSPGASFPGLVVVGGTGIDAPSINARPPSSELRSYDRGAGLAANYYSWYRQDGNMSLYNSLGSKQPIVITPNGTLNLAPDVGFDALALPGNGVISTFGQMQIDSRNGGHLYLNPYSNYVLPMADNIKHLGHPSVRWITLYSVQAPVVGSSLDLKEDITPLDPVACVASVLATDWVNYAYKPPAPPDRKEGADDADWQTTQEAYRAMLVAGASGRRQKGYVLDSPDHAVGDLFGLPDRKNRSDGADIAVVACALQQALREIADLKARLV